MLHQFDVDASLAEEFGHQSNLFQLLELLFVVCVDCGYVFPEFPLVSIVMGDAGRPKLKLCGIALIFLLHRPCSLGHLWLAFTGIVFHMLDQGEQHIIEGILTEPFLEVRQRNFHFLHRSLLTSLLSSSFTGRNCCSSMTLPVLIL
jgi:hypothetical protein